MKSLTHLYLGTSLSRYFAHCLSNNKYKNVNDHSQRVIVITYFQWGNLYDPLDISNSDTNVKAVRAHKKKRQTLYESNCYRKQSLLRRGTARVAYSSLW